MNSGKPGVIRLLWVPVWRGGELHLSKVGVLLKWCDREKVTRVNGERGRGVVLMDGSGVSG